MATGSSKKTTASTSSSLSSSSTSEVAATNKTSCICQLTGSIALCCMIGVLLSIYALNIEMHAESDPSYEAMCDISEHVSCTKVFTSKYGKGFGIIGPIFGEKSVLNQPNPLYGIFFYSLIGFLTFINTVPASKFQVSLCISSIIASIYLAYLLYFVLYDFCIVCISTYLVNVINLYLSVKRHMILKSELLDEKKLN